MYQSGGFAAYGEYQFTCSGTTYSNLPAPNYSYITIGTESSGYTTWGFLTTGTITFEVGKKGNVYINASNVNVYNIANGNRKTINLIIGEPKPANYVEVNLTSNLEWKDNTSEEATSRYLQCSGTGTGDDSKAYDVTLRINTTSPSGTFTASSLDLENSYINQASTKINVTSADITTKEVSDQITQLEATLIGDNGKTYYITGQFTRCQTSNQIASWAMFSFNNDNIGSDNTLTKSTLQWAHNGGTFLQLHATNSSTKKYIQLLFWLNSGNTQSYNGLIGPKTGNYNIKKRTYLNNNSLYTYGSTTKDVVLAIDEDRGFGYGSLVGNQYNGYICNIMELADDNGNVYYVSVASGKDGNIYVQLIRTSDGRVTATIGEPALAANTYYLNSYTNGEGSVELSPNDCSYTVGTNVTLTPTAQEGYYFSNWSGTDGSSVTDNGDGTYNLTTSNRNMAVTANFSNIYTLGAWDADGGDMDMAGATTAGDYAYGTTLDEPIAYKDGYTFLKWVDGDGVDFNGTMPAKNVTYIAQYTPNEYTIALNEQEPTTSGTPSITATYNTNTNLTDPIDIPAKTDYTFGGYYTAVDGGGVQVIDANGNILASVSGYTDASKNYIHLGDITLFAYWVSSGYQLKWSVNGDVTLDGGTADGIYAVGTAITAPTPTRTGFTFAGWYPDVPATMPDNDLTFYATWQQVQNEDYCIDSEGYTAQGTPYWILTGTGSFYSAHNTKYDPYDDDFEEYTPLFDGKEYTDILKSSDGSFDSITYVLHFNCHREYTKHNRYYEFFGSQIDNRISQGTIWLDDESDSYTHPADAALVLTLAGRDANNEIAKRYTTDSGCDSIIVYTVRQSPLLTWDAGEGEFTSGVSTQTQRLKPTTAITLPAVTPTREGFDFTGWLTVGGDDVAATMGETDITYVAQWTATLYTLKWQTEDVDYVATNTTSLTAGTAITPPAAPTRSGYTFNGWYPAFNEGDVMPMADKTYYATWTADAQNGTLCVDEDGFTNEGEYDWYIPGFDEHNDKFDPTDANPNGTPYRYDRSQLQYTDILRSWDNSFDSIVYTLNLTYSRFYDRYTRFSGDYIVVDGNTVTISETTVHDSRATLADDVANGILNGTVYLNPDDPTAHFIANGNTYTIADAGEQSEDVRRNQFASLGQCDSTLKFTIAPMPLLTWDANGGSFTSDGATQHTAHLVPTVVLPSPEVPCRAGYTFGGWDGTPAFVDGTTTMTTTDLTYTAIWNKVDYTITYEELNGADNTNPTSYNVESEDIVFVTPGTRSGFTFVEWQDEN
ncbi:MAG: InlB B-repeat-containing protein, partial [Paludibacteraceae bacterium]|nr:InlB B-repeat-containing protein [Paludibacteraceae bacterium]